MQQLHRAQPSQRPLRVLQFGGGNFLRGFFDWYVDILNETQGLNADVLVLRSTAGNDAPLLDTQGGVYTTLVRGLNEAGAPVKQFRQIQCVRGEVDLRKDFDAFIASAHEPALRFIVSNTTEAGIAANEVDAYEDRPPASFPAKLTRWLHERYRAFNGQPDKGVYVLPCELIDDNGPALKRCVLHFAQRWNLEPGFTDWLDRSCFFCSTLVDRIVPGHPAAEMAALENELGYRDPFLVAAEYFNLFVIQGPAALAQELKLQHSGLHINLVEDIKPFKLRKVGILNGGHTLLVPIALLAGLESVGAAMNDELVTGFLVDALREEVIPTLPLPASELQSFAADVLRRFSNPFIHHRLESIALNSWSKFAVRVMPQLLRYQEQEQALPKRLVLALAATMHLYRGRAITLKDDSRHLEWFAGAWSHLEEGRWNWADLAGRWLENADLWGRDLSAVPGLVDALAADLEAIEKNGIRRTLERSGALTTRTPALT